MTESHLLEPTLIGAVRQNWLPALVVAAIVGASALGLVLISSESSHVAEASVLLENPRDAVLFQSSNVSDVDYVADQIDILGSAEIARLAADAALEVDPDFGYDTIGFLTQAEILGGGDRALVVIRFSAETPEWAVIGANAMVSAYQTFLESETSEAFAASIAALDREVATLEEEIITIQAQIEDEIGVENAKLGGLRSEIAELLPLIAEAARDLPGADEERSEEISAQLAQINSIVDAARVISDLDVESPNQAVLQRRLDRLVDRVGSMSERRDNLAVDASLLGQGVRLATPALVSEQSSATDLRTLLAAAFVAGLAGLAVAYWLALRRRAFKSPVESGLALAAPVLGVLPSDPRGPTPASFGFIVEPVREWAARSVKAPIVGVTAANRQAGVTSSVVGFATALSEAGERVLVVDGDFDARELTRALAPEAIGAPGLSDVLDATVGRRSGVVELGGSVALAPRGTRQVEPGEALSIVDVIGRMAEDYDVVLVDIPGILSDPLTAALVQGSDHIVAIVGHGGRLIDVERLRDNLDQLDAVCDGVVFSKVPAQTVARMAGG
ncbi:MAG: hypothetical protein OEX04_05180 [Acidimicrobiia bacterium]|nr:hypothetical protein [Acidimicrobiia bacterium]MDH4306851.1 hypothetical protein [Acidimicrobiia bacterium]MDH5292851.1 hypothetical protein [Acidimicrobiia bacterium]